MPKRKLKDGVHGPYRERGGKLWRIIIADGGVKSACFAPSEEEARRVVEDLRAEIDGRSQTEIGTMIDRYVEHKRATGSGSGYPTTIAHRLNGFFDRCAIVGSLEMPGRGQELYELYKGGHRFSPAKNGHSERARSADTHRNTLAYARAFCAWLVKPPQKMIRFNPLADVEGEGDRKAGKDGLSIDEMLRLESVTYEAAEAGEESASAVLSTLTFGVRASEMVVREARDLDNGGQLFRIPRLKKRGKVQVDVFRVPDALQPILRARAANGGRLWPERDRHWLLREVRRYCARAKVPVVCTHALRGSIGSGLRFIGAPLEQIRDALAHEHTGVTSRSYVSAEAEVAATQRARFAVLRGGRQ
jgi:integrase